MYKKPYRKSTRPKRETFRSDRPLPILSKALFESKVRLNKIPEVKNVSVLQFDNQDRLLTVLASVNMKYNQNLHDRLYLANYELHERFKKRGVKLDVTFGW